MPGRGTDEVAPRDARPRARAGRRGAGDAAEAHPDAGARFPKLDEAALAAARTWKFEPAKDESGKAMAGHPQAELDRMEAFTATTGLIFLMSSSKPMDVRMAMMKGMKTMYPEIAARCEARPEAKYMGVVAGAMTDAAKRGK